jgi:indolepyruvate ferredoxin oxidoreductase beta subunit
MAYEDVIRVAQLKIRPERLARVRAEAGAGEGEPVRISEFLKPGVEEVCALLPGVLARPILGWAARRGLTDRLSLGLAVPTTSVSGFVLLWVLARLRPLRRLGHRFAEEQARIDDWLALIREAAGRDPALAGEIAECARLIKGYGETLRRGLANYERIRDALVVPALAGAAPAADAAALVRRAREAALADPDRTALDEVLDGFAGSERTSAPAQAAE